MFSRFTRAVNRFVASPIATMLAFASIFIWAGFGPSTHYSELWQLTINSGTSVLTYLVMFVVANAQARDTAAISVKLDALILGVQDADNRIIAIEEKSADEADALAQEVRTAST